MRSIILFFTLFCLIPQVFAADTAKMPLKKYKIVRFSIHEEIAPAATRKTMKAFELAEQQGADLIVMNMDTYGGLVSDADSMRTRILNSKIPVYVFVENNAASAGALISIACNKIIMRKGATIGAATVVNQEGEKVPDKYQSYMRSKMRATAEARGRNPDIAQGMVDGDIVVPGVNEKGKVITLTTTEAIKHGFCDVQAETLEEALQQLGINNYEIVEPEETMVDKAMGFLMHPGVSGALMLLIFLGIYYELQSPGLGFPSVIAVGAAILYFAPLYLDGLAANWEILLFIIGFVLLMIEIFAIPGFGIAGISGIVLIFSALVLSLIRNVNFDFSFTTGDEITFAFVRILVSAVVFIFILIFTWGTFMRTSLFKKLVQEHDLSDSRVNTLAETMTGKAGLCFADLRPQGKVKIDGTIYPATSFGEYIERGAAIQVVREEGGILLVRRTDTAL